MVIWSCFMEQLDQISLDVSVEKMVQHFPLKRDILFEASEGTYKRHSTKSSLGQRG